MAAIFVRGQDLQFVRRAQVDRNFCHLGHRRNFYISSSHLAPHKYTIKQMGFGLEHPESRSLKTEIGDI
jgi:hypothetical protein